MARARGARDGSWAGQYGRLVDFAELVRVRGAHREQLLTPLDLDLEHAAEAAVDPLDGADVTTMPR